MFPAAVSGAVSKDELNCALSDELTAYPEELFGLDWCEIGHSHKEQWLTAVYSGPDIHSIWVGVDGPTEQAKHIFTALKNGDAEGLNSQDYGVERIASLWDKRTAADLAKLDVFLTLGLLGYVHDMEKGRLTPKVKNPRLFDRAGGEGFDPLAVVFQARMSTNMADYLGGLAPGHRHYQALKRELKRYRKIAAQGGWPEVSTGNLLHPGDVDPRIPVVRQVLVITGDLKDSVNLSQELYDDLLVEAVRSFQERHGLTVDGLIGPRTTRALRVPVEKRIEQILLNMERWRWTEHELGAKYVLIDIAGFNLQGVIDDQILLEMRVIVGKRHHQTPVFSDTIKYVEFHPFWNVTPSIARNEMLPELRKDSSYLADKHIRVFSSWQSDATELNPLNIDWSKVSRKEISRYKLRQDPGPWNALGVVKFVFPNKYSVYLHDTPVQSLFEEAARAFSHGCIRLNKPIELAHFLLLGSHSRLNRDSLQQVIDTKERKIIRLQEKVPVHLVYQTVWVDKNEALHFSRDLYGRDQQLGDALFGSKERR